MKNNRFGAIANDESDDEVIQQKTTKTQAKKQERKITEKAPKINPSKMEEGGFEMINKTGETKKRDEPKQHEGGRGRGRGNGRGGRGGNITRLDQDGNPVREHANKERQPFAGKPREGAHPYDRKSGTGRGRRPENKRDGHGKGNWGDNQEQVYKQKGTDEGDERKPEEEEKKKEEPKEKEEEKVQVIEEVIGVSLDDFKQTRNATQKKEARQAEGIKGAKVEAHADEKEKQSTVLQNQYLKGGMAKTADVNNVYLGFGNVADDDEIPQRGRGGRGGRGGRRGGGDRDRAHQEGGNRGGRRQNAKHALKKTEDDFPSL